MSRRHDSQMLYVGDMVESLGPVKCTGKIRGGDRFCLSFVGLPSPGAVLVQVLELGDSVEKVKTLDAAFDRAKSSARAFGYNGPGLGSPVQKAGLIWECATLRQKIVGHRQRFDSRSRTA